MNRAERYIQCDEAWIDLQIEKAFNDADTAFSKKLFVAKKKNPRLLSSLPQEFVTKVLNSPTFVDYQLTPNPKFETVELISKAVYFAQLTSHIARENLLEDIDYHQKTSPHQFSPRHLDRLAQEEMFTPEFTVFDRQNSQERLREIQYRYTIRDENALLIFDLPAPLYFDTRANDVAPTHSNEAIWAPFSARYSKTIRTAAAKDTPAQYGLNFVRINGAGEHHPLKYYYMWEVQTASMQASPKKENRQSRLPRSRRSAA